MTFLRTILNLFKKKKIKVDMFLDLLTISNSSFKKISKEVEEHIFSHEILNYDLPEEYQAEAIIDKKNFDSRFAISAGITGMAIIEYVVNEKYGASLLEKDLLSFKKQVFANILKLREQVLTYPKPYQFDEDTELSLIDSIGAEARFTSLITHRASLINHLIFRTGDYRNIYYHFYLALGQVLPAQDRIFYHPDFANVIDKKILEIVQMIEQAFNSLDLKE